MVFVENSPGEWKPIKEEEFITGVLIKIQSEVGPTKSMLYSIEREGGDVMGVWGSTILDQRMIGVKVGDIIKIVYKGLGEKQPGKNPPKLFKVLIDRPEMSKP